jgi:hypothetical protein
MIDNYIYIWLLRVSPDFVTGILQDSDPYNTNTNFLNQSFTTPGVFGSQTSQYQKYLFSFLYSGQNGEGWAAAGDAPANRENISASEKRFHQAPFVHESMFGKLRNYDEKFIYKQMRNFISFLDWTVIVTRKWAYNKQLYLNLFKLLQDVKNRLINIQFMAMQLDEFLRIMSFNCMTYQDTDKEGILSYIVSSDPDYYSLNANNYSDNDTIQQIGASFLPLRTQGAGQILSAAVNVTLKDIVSVTRKLIEPGQVAAWIWGVDWAKLINFPMNYSIIQAGFSWNNKITEIVENYALSRLFLPKSIYSKAERISWALSKTKNNLATLLKDAIMKQSHTYVIPLTGSTHILRIYDVVGKYFKKRKPFYGYTETVYFNPRKDKAQMLADTFKIHNIAQRENAISTLTVNDLIKQIQEETLYNLTESSVEGNRAIKFEIPVPLVFGDPSKEDFVRDVFSFDSDKLKMHTLKLIIRWSDDPRRLVQNEFAFLKPPIWSTPDVPFMIITADTLLSLLRTVTVRQRITIWDIERFAIARRNQ